MGGGVNFGIRIRGGGVPAIFYAATEVGTEVGA